MTKYVAASCGPFCLIRWFIIRSVPWSLGNSWNWWFNLLFQFEIRRCLGGSSAKKSTDFIGHPDIGPMLAFSDHGLLMIWVRSRRCGCLVTWFCYHLIAKPGNKTAAPSWLDPYDVRWFQMNSMAVILMPNHVAASHSRHLEPIPSLVLLGLLPVPWPLARAQPWAACPP